MRPLSTSKIMDIQGIGSVLCEVSRWVVGTFAEKKNTLAVFYDTWNGGCEFPEYSRDLSSHLTNISKEYTVLDRGARLAHEHRRLWSLLSSLWTSASACAETSWQLQYLLGGMRMIGISRILFKHKTSTGVTYHNHSIEDDISQTVFEWTVLICTHTPAQICMRHKCMYLLWYTVLWLFLRSVNKYHLSPQTRCW